MLPKVREKELVIEMRKRGLTYREILKEVAVSKSSVSLWLKDYPLTKEEKVLLARRKNKDITRWKLRAANSLAQARKERERALYAETREVFAKNLENPLFQVGIALYWAEGTKRANSFAFTNSDPDMVRLMILWIQKFLNVSLREVGLRIFTHKAFSGENHEKFWSEQTNIPLSQFKKTIYKSQNGLAVKRRPNYAGCARIELGKVRYLKQLLFLQQMLIEHHKNQG